MKVDKEIYKAMAGLARRITELEMKVSNVEAYIRARREAVPGEHRYGLR